MILIFDLDHTLLNSEKIKKNFSKIFKMRYEDYCDSYHRLFGRQSDLYNPYAHLDLLLSQGIITESERDLREKQIKKIVSQLNLFVFPESELILKHFNGKKNKMILISHGNKKWQKEKIDHLKIKKYFDRILITEKDKTCVLDFLIDKKDDILIINDNAKENGRFKKKLPNSRMILIKGIHSKDNIKNKSYSLKQAAKILINKY